MSLELGAVFKYREIFSTAEVVSQKWTEELRRRYHTLESMWFSRTLCILLLELFLVNFRTRSFTLARIICIREHHEGKNDQETVPVARMQQSFEPELSPEAGSLYINLPFHDRNCSSYRRSSGYHHSQISLGYACAETTNFFKECQKLCEIHSGLPCRRVMNYWREHAKGCKGHPFLGYVRSPFCRFYRRCFRLLRPSGRNRFWWKIRSVRRLLRGRGCFRHHV